MTEECVAVAVRVGGPELPRYWRAPVICLWCDGDVHRGTSGYRLGAGRARWHRQRRSGFPAQSSIQLGPTADGGHGPVVVGSGRGAGRTGGRRPGGFPGIDPRLCGRFQWSARRDQMGKDTRVRRIRSARCRSTTRRTSSPRTVQWYCGHTTPAGQIGARAAFPAPGVFQPHRVNGRCGRNSTARAVSDTLSCCTRRAGAGRRKSISPRVRPEVPG